jgi:hypothetical protein
LTAKQDQYLREDLPIRIEVKGFGKRHSLEEQQRLIRNLDVLPWRARANLNNPKVLLLFTARRRFVRLFGMC